MSPSVTLDHDESLLLAGLLYGKGRFYVSTPTRESGSTRWVTSWSVEMPGDPTEHWPILTAVFGSPKPRRSFGREGWRYVLADREAIVRLAERLSAAWPTGEHPMAAVAGFCKAPSEASLATVRSFF